MMPEFKLFLFAFLVYNCNIECLNCLELQPRVPLELPENSTDEFDKILDLLHKRYGNGTGYALKEEDGPNKFDSKNTSANKTFKSQVLSSHHGSYKQTHGDKNFKDLENKGDKENVEKVKLDRKIMIQPPGMEVIQPKDTKSKESTNTALPVTLSVTNSNESNDELKRVSGSKPMEHNTKDVINLTNNNPSENANDSVRGVGITSNNTALVEAVGSTGTSLLCVENICQVLTYLVMFISPFYTISQD